MQVDLGGMPLAVHQCFQLTCGTSFIELRQNYPGEIIALEGWYRSLNAQVSSYYPTFWKFLNNLKRDESVI